MGAFNGGFVGMMSRFYGLHWCVYGGFLRGFVGMMGRFYGVHWCVYGGSESSDRRTRLS